jgi:hypothetical protein
VSSRGAGARGPLRRPAPPQVLTAPRLRGLPCGPVGRPPGPGSGWTVAMRCPGKRPSAASGDRSAGWVGIGVWTCYHAGASGWGDRSSWPAPWGRPRRFGPRVLRGPLALRFPVASPRITAALARGLRPDSAPVGLGQWATLPAGRTQRRPWRRAARFWEAGFPQAARPATPPPGRSAPTMPCEPSVPAASRKLPAALEPSSSAFAPFPGHPIAPGPRPRYPSP